MNPAHVREQAVGMRYYASETPGIGGRLRQQPADFIVTEHHSLDVKPVDADPGAYPYLLLEVTLTDWETTAFIQAFAKHAGIDPDHVAVAGTKDARAVTTQLVSVRDVNPEEVPALPDAEITVLGRYGRQLEFGDHDRNAFEIVVRESTGGSTAVEHTVAALNRFSGGDQVAVPNFFGIQRFGTYRPITHEVGLAIVRGDFRRAVHTYVGKSDHREPARTRRARASLHPQPATPAAWQTILDALPGYLNFERTIAAELAGTSTLEAEAYRASIEALPWSLQRLFVQAAQSYLFNEFLSERLRRGLSFVEPVVGDTICFFETDNTVAVDRPQAVTKARLEVARRHCRLGNAVITAPVIGSQTELGTGTPGSIARAILRHHELEPQDFAGTGQFDQTGTHRPIAVSTALNVEYSPLTFQFALPAGSYATVLIREFCKGDPVNFS